MKILQQNSTHKAVLNGDKIDIIMKGLIIPVGYEYPNGDKEADGYEFKEEKLYSINKEDQDDLFSIFENLDETNRCNLAEANAAFGDMTEQELQSMVDRASEEQIPAPGHQPPVITEQDEQILAADPQILEAREELNAARPVEITFECIGDDTMIFANDILEKVIKTPKPGISCSWQELNLEEVERIAQQLFPGGFSLPYFVDGGGYVRREQSTNLSTSNQLS
jgi:hypothetical protein